MITYIIADDETPARDELKYFLDKYNDFLLVGEASDGENALTLCKIEKPNVAFLDIQMPGLTGVEVTSRLLKLKEPPFIVFVTAFDSYAIEAFDLHAIDYILKPIEHVRLENAVTHIRNIVNSGNDLENSVKKIKALLNYTDSAKNISPFITLCNEEQYFPIAFEEIKYAHVINKRTYITTEDGKFCYKNTLTHFKEEAPTYLIRVHRAYVVNIHFIEKIDLWFNGTYQITIKGGKETVPVSRHYLKHFKNIMKIE